MSYTKFLNFGISTNKNVSKLNDPSNPLTFCLWDNATSNFIHGASALDYKPYCAECSTYMKEIGNGQHGFGPWGTININGQLQSYCEFYVQNNTSKRHPNLGAINSPAFELYNNACRVKNTVGENLIRNTAELRFLKYMKGCSSNTLSSFDPNIAAISFINLSQNNCGNCPVIVTIPDDIDDDLVMNRVLLQPKVATDVLAYIWAAAVGAAPGHIILNGNLNGTKLEKHLEKNSDYYNYWFNVIKNGLQLFSSCSTFNDQCEI